MSSEDKKNTIHKVDRGTLTPYCGTYPEDGLFHFSLDMGAVTRKECKNRHAGKHTVIPEMEVKTK